MYVLDKVLYRIVKKFHKYNKIAVKYSLPSCRN